MKNLFYLIVFFAFSTGAYAATYYTCNSASGTNLTTASDGSGSCNVAIGTWNQSGNTIVIRTGTTLTVGNVNFACQVTVETGATLQTTGPGFLGSRTITFSNTTSINGTFSMPGGFISAKAMNIASGANVTVGSTGTISIPDQLTSETITVQNGGTLTLNGTINSIENFNVNATATFNGGTTGRLTIENASFQSTAITFTDNFYISSGTITGAGDITMVRNFPANPGWNHISWPVNSFATVNDLVATGFVLNITGPNPNQINVYYWDAATAGWLVPTSSTPLAGQALNIYTFNTGTSVSLTVDVSNFNNAPLSQSYNYFDPGTNPPGNATDWSTTTTDGWNMWANPFQSYLNPDDLALPADLDDAAYVWNGSTYSSRVNGVGALTEISPNQSFFVRSDGNTGNHSIPNAARTTGTTSFFKTAPNDVVEFVLSGDGYNESTFIYQTDGATVYFDRDYDALYFKHDGNAPVFNSVGIDSTSYSVQALPDLSLNNQFLTFDYGTSGKSFTIWVDPSKLSGLTNLYLHDLYTSTTVDLKQGAYTFTSATQAPAQRFKLTFIPEPPCTTNPVSTTMQAYNGAHFLPQLDPNTFYFGTTQWKRIRVKKSGGVGPFTYSWGKVGTGQLKGNLSGSSIYLYEPFGPTKVYVTISDAGTGCDVTDTMDIAWDDQYFCGTISPRSYKLIVCEGGTNKCVPWKTAKTLIKSGNATLGPCALPTKLSDTRMSGSLYPNPTNQAATLEFVSKHAGNGTLLVMDLNGRVLQQAEIRVKVGVQYQNIDLSGMPNGMYLVRLSTDQEVLTERLQLIK